MLVFEVVRNGWSKPDLHMVLWKGLYCAWFKSHIWTYHSIYLLINDFHFWDRNYVKSIKCLDLIPYMIQHVNIASKDNILLHTVSVLDSQSSMKLWISFDFFNVLILRSFTCFKPKSKASYLVTLLAASNFKENEYGEEL